MIIFSQNIWLLLMCAVRHCSSLFIFLTQQHVNNPPSAITGHNQPRNTTIHLHITATNNGRS